jgi:hypothetical protein
MASREFSGSVCRLGIFPVNPAIEICSRPCGSQFQDIIVCCEGVPVAQLDRYNHGVIQLIRILFEVGREKGDEVVTFPEPTLRNLKGYCCLRLAIECYFSDRVPIHLDVNQMGELGIP